MESSSSPGFGPMGDDWNPGTREPDLPRGQNSIKIYSFFGFKFSQYRKITLKYEKI
jgi:hypothetical protein